MFPGFFNRARQSRWIPFYLKRFIQLSIQSKLNFKFANRTGRPFQTIQHRNGIPPQRGRVDNAPANPNVSAAESALPNLQTKSADDNRPILRIQQPFIGIVAKSSSTACPTLQKKPQTNDFAVSSSFPHLSKVQNLPTAKETLVFSASPQRFFSVFPSRQYNKR